MPITRQNGRFEYTGPAAVISALAPDPDCLAAFLQTLYWIDDSGILDHVCNTDGEHPDHVCDAGKFASAVRPLFDYVMDDLPALAQLAFLGQNHDGMMMRVPERSSDALPNPAEINEAFEKMFRDILGEDDGPTTL